MTDTVNEFQELRTMADRALLDSNLPVISRLVSKLIDVWEKSEQAVTALDDDNIISGWEESTGIAVRELRSALDAMNETRA